MSKKDFEMIARVLREADAIAEEKTGHTGKDYRKCLEELRGEFADALGRVSATFDRQRFLTACIVPK